MNQEQSDARPARQKPVTLAWVGDLHLTHADHPNYASAVRIIDELNRVVKPDAVQFAGDNAQHARDDEFDLFNALRARVSAKEVHALVGDHDVFHDPAAAYTAKVGKPYGSYSIGRFRFVRLNTMDVAAGVDLPHDLGPKQLDWFAAEAEAAAAAGQRVVLCQHHYPFKVFEQFESPGTPRWRQVVAACRPVVVLCGHTHYGQVANDGQNVFVTTRSVGDPEGGPAAYTIIHLDDGELALRQRSVGEAGPILLIVQPRQALLATGPDDIVTSKLHVKVRCWTDRPLVGLVQARLNDEPWTDLDDEGDGVWAGDPSHELPRKGPNVLAVRATDIDGRADWHAVRFAVDPTRRFTPTPAVDPVVDRTDFC